MNISYERALALAAAKFSDQSARAAWVTMRAERDHYKDKLAETVAERDATRIALNAASESRDEAIASLESIRAALTPTSETKAAFIGEFRDPELSSRRPISWTVVKEIMRAIRSYSDGTWKAS